MMIVRCHMRMNEYNLQVTCTKLMHITNWNDIRYIFVIENFWNPNEMPLSYINLNRYGDKSSLVKSKVITWANNDPACPRLKTFLGLSELTHWDRMTHICVVTNTNIGSDNGLSHGRRQTIIWTNAGILLIGPWGTIFSEILIEILTFSFKKMRLKMSSAKWRPFFSASMCLCSHDNKAASHRVVILHSFLFDCGRSFTWHCSEGIMGTMAPQITNLTIVYSAVHSGANRRKHQSSASLSSGRWSVNSPHKWPVTRKMFPLDDIIMNWE